MKQVIIAAIIFIILAVCAGAWIYTLNYAPYIAL